MQEKGEKEKKLKTLEYGCDRYTYHMHMQFIHILNGDYLWMVIFRFHDIHFQNGKKNKIY